MRFRSRRRKASGSIAGCDARLCERHARYVVNLEGTLKGCRNNRYVALRETSLKSTIAMLTSTLSGCIRITYSTGRDTRKASRHTRLLTPTPCGVETSFTLGIVRHALKG